MAGGAGWGTSSGPRPAGRGLPLILASASPRRHALLAGAGFAFTVAPAAVDETPLPGLRPDELAVVLARRKAVAVAARYVHAVVLGVDTVVDQDGQVLGKPRDDADAVAILTRLQGRRHAVHTAMTVVHQAAGLDETRLVSALVTMRPLTEAEIRAYVATGEPLDKAGAYAIQGLAGAFISAVEGSRVAVIGLAVDELAPMLHRAGVAVG